MMALRRPTWVASWVFVCLISLTAATLVSLRWSSALSLPARDRDVTRLQVELTSLRAQQQTLIGQTASVQSVLTTEQVKVLALTKDAKAQAGRIRALRSQVTSLHRQLGALKS